MNRKVVFVFLVLVFGVAIMASLTLLQDQGTPVLEYSEIRAVAAQDCMETNVSVTDGVIDSSKSLSEYTSEMMSRSGYDPLGVITGEYSHLGNSYVEGTEYCWLIAFSKPGDAVWSVLYETGDGSVREFFARVH